MKEIITKLINKFSINHISDHTKEGDELQDAIMAKEAMYVVDEVSIRFGEWLLVNAELKTVIHSSSSIATYWVLRGNNDLKVLDGYEGIRYSTKEIYEHFKRSL